MRPWRASLLVWLLLTSVTYGGEAEKTPSPPRYQVLRYQEDYSVLGGAPRADWLDYFKHRPLWRDDLRLTVGGQARLRYEFKEDEVFGSGRPASDGYLLQRYRVHGDLRYQDWLRVFAEGKFAYSCDRERTAPLIFDDHSDFQNLFVDLIAYRKGKDRLVVRVGRQELLYGRERLVSSFDWANVMRTFDGARVLWTLDQPKRGRWQIDAWWTRLVQIDDDDAWNEPDGNTQFFGVYAAHKGSAAGYDVYALGLSADGRTSPNGKAGTDTRMTFGTRLWCRRPRPWDFEVEAAWQTGRFAGQCTNAWMLAAEVGYTFEGLFGGPRLSGGYDYASGDDSPGDSRVSTFNQLFPLGHAHLGYIDVVGRQNIHAVRVRADLKPLKTVASWIQFYSFWLDERRDALYNAGGAAVRRDAAGNSGSYVGSEIDVVLKWQVDRHSAVLTGYSHFFPGGFVKDTGPGRDIDFVYLQYQFTF